MADRSKKEVPRSGSARLFEVEVEVKEDLAQEKANGEWVLVSLELRYCTS